MMTVPTRVERVAVLWRHVTGYLQAALKAMLDDEKVSLFVVQSVQHPNARFDLFSHGRCAFVDLSELPADDIHWLDRLRSFDPEIALITGVRDRRYLLAARQIRRRGGLTVWANDRVLRVPLRDLYQAAVGRLLKVWRDFDVALVPGSAAARYACRIGFPSDLVFEGLYTCDTSLFRPVGLRRHGNRDGSAWPRVFLYVGQFIERKGVDTLVEAYQRYRLQCSEPWELWCAGAGPLRPMLEHRDGVHILDFLSPRDCAMTMAQSGALVIPSRWDHWGVVVHEATCAGLPVIASKQTLASVELVQDGYNGFTFSAGSVSHLAHLLTECSRPQTAREMGESSLRMSYRFDPSIFARQVLVTIPSAYRALRI